MKGFLEEYGLIIVVVAVILLMLLFGKTGYAKSIQNAILGSADHIVETGENITKGLDVKTGDVIDIKGTKYIVLEQKGGGKSLVIPNGNIFHWYFQANYDIDTKLRPDGQNANTYEGSTIDKWLETTYYDNNMFLPSYIKAAIQPTNIKQSSYNDGYNPDSKQETGYNGQVYNTISRYLFLPSVSEIGKVVDLKNPDKVKSFLNNSVIWTRDSLQGSATAAETLFRGGIEARNIGFQYDIRPAFVIDLLKVDYEVTGHVDYK